MKCFLATIKGSVQGVGFRFNTVQKAQQLDIGGWVKNLSDDSVEVFAEGEEKQIEEFIAFLKKGPFGSRVKKITIEEKVMHGLTNFEVRY
ncbi:MAG: acylphosphatase [archaeon]|jgi:acylphosphatase